MEARLFLALVFTFSAPFYACVLLADSPRWTGRRMQADGARPASVSA